MKFLNEEPVDPKKDLERCLVNIRAPGEKSDLQVLQNKLKSMGIDDMSSLSESNISTNESARTVKLDYGTATANLVLTEAGFHNFDDFTKGPMAMSKLILLRTILNQPGNLESCDVTQS